MLVLNPGASNIKKKSIHLYKFYYCLELFIRYLSRHIQITGGLSL